ncbi:MAG: tetratricopeptide repeat protein [Nitrospirae bacterium]|nr:tetratricopeptide repeat protein [Nitrospirota bacterium]
MPPSKENEFSLSPELDRLSSQLAKDPKSKLFMPLAEEYIKSGMAEEAIMTLEEGLKVHPSYMSARVLLGKAFLEKGDLENARAQFESVVKAIPDNLFAYKKLGEVYKGLGMYPEAKKSYKMVLMLHPKDAEAKNALEMLEGGVPIAEAKPEEKKPAQPAPQVFDLTDVGGEEAPAAAMPDAMPEPEAVPDAGVQLGDAGQAVMEMPVPEMETLEQVKRAQETEPSPAIQSLPSMPSIDDTSDFGFATEAADEADEAEESGPPTYVLEDDGGFEFAAEEPVDESGPPMYVIEDEGGFGFAAEETADEFAAPTYEIEEEPAQSPADAGDIFAFGVEGGSAHELAPGVETDVFDMESSPLVMEDEHFDTPPVVPAYESLEPPAIAPAYEYLEPAAPDDAFSWSAEGGGAHELTPEVESDMFDLESSPLVMEDEHFGQAPAPAYLSFEPPPLASPHEYLEQAVPPAASDDAFSWSAGMEEHEPAAETGADIFGIESSPLVMEDEHFETPAPRPAPGSGYAIDLGEVEGVKDIFDAYRDDASSLPQVGENEEVYEIPDDLSAFAMDGFKLEPPEAGLETSELEAAVPATFVAGPEPAGPAKEMFETETLAELYVSQGFYDRAINIYKSLSVERPDDLVIQQKLKELYQLAHMSASMGEFGMPVDTGKPEPVSEGYTPLDFEAAARAEEAAASEQAPMPASFGGFGGPDEDLWAAPHEAEAAEGDFGQQGFADKGVAEAGFMETAVPDDDAWGAMAAPAAASENFSEARADEAPANMPADPLAAGRLEGLLDKIRRKRAI